MKNKVVVDMHSHTINSDGTYTVEELVELAKNKGLKVIAITDHDTVDGLLDEKKINILEKEYDIKIIRGIEMSCNLNGKDVHILGYFLNLQDKDFLNELKNISKIRDERNEKIIKKLEKINLPVTMKDLDQVVKGNIISKAHFAEVMIKKGYVNSKAEAFQNYLGKNGLAFVEKKDYQPEKAVMLLNKNGAFISLAHPKYISESVEEIEKLIKRLIPLGLKGIEINYYSFNKNDKEMYKKLADKFNLLITGGSDFHGGNRVEVSLGQTGLNEEEYENLKKNLNLM